MTLTPTPLSTETLARVAGGTAGFNEIEGSWKSETINGTTGSDEIHAGSGNDSVNAGTGDDEIHGEGGNDFITARSGNDTVFGDECPCDTGDDILIGGGGSDELHGDAPGETEVGGNDAMDGGTGDEAGDQAFGGGGDDSYVWGVGDGNDEFHGDAGNDLLLLDDLTLADLQAGLQLTNSSLLLSLNEAGEVTFIDPATNQAVAFSGSLTIGTETLRFYNIEKIRFTG
jgi:Ca2+-binding RTX toxin-like protein